LALSLLIALLCVIAIAAVTTMGLRARTRQRLIIASHLTPQLPYTPRAITPAPAPRDTRDALLDTLPALPNSLEGPMRVADRTMTSAQRKLALTRLGKTPTSDLLVGVLARTYIESTRDDEEQAREACLAALYQHYKTHPHAQGLLRYLAVRHDKAVWRVKCIEALVDQSDEAKIALALQSDAPLRYRKKLVREVIPKASGAQLAPHMKEILRSAPQPLANQALSAVLREQSPGAEDALLDLLRSPSPQQKWALTQALAYLANRRVAAALPFARALMAQRQHQYGAISALEQLGEPQDLPGLDELARRRLMGGPPPAMREAAGRAATAIRARVNKASIGGLMLAEGSDAAGGLEVAHAPEGQLSLHEADGQEKRGG
jgi:hypothetical protein